MEYIAIFCTTNSIENAELIGNTLVQEQLAACTNIIPKLTSIYSWDNQIVKDGEVFLIIKTRKELFEDVKNKIITLHNYEVPEIIAIDIKEGSKPYLEWIKENTK